MAIGNDFQLDVVANAQALDKSIKAVTTTKTYKIKIEADGTQTNTLAQSTEKLANAQGQLLNVTTKYNKEGQATSAVVKDISKNVKGLGADFISTLGKVAKFGVVTALLGLFTTGVTEAVQAVKEFDDATTEFSKVSNYSREEIQAYSDTLGNLGKSVYRTKTEMLDAATSFKKSGFTEEESANLARVAALYQNIADEELSAADASEVIISQMKAFALSAGDAEHIVDAINIVSNEFSVSSSDIGKGLTAAGAALNTYGNDFEEVIGLVSAGTEIFQGKSQQVARGLNTVAGRITNNIDLLDKYHIAVYDENEQIRSTYDILGDLSKIYGNLSDSEKIAIGDALAGTNQRKIFAAVMTNFQTAIDATAKAYDSLGSAEEENAKQSDTIKVKLQQLKAQFQELALGDGGLNNFLKGLVDLGTGILKLINNLGGLNTIIGVTISLLIAFKGAVIAQAIVTAIKNIGSLTLGFKNLIMIIPNAITAWKAYSSGVVSANAAMQASMGVFALLGLAITGIALIVNKYKKSQEEANQARLDTIKNAESEIEVLNSLKDKVKNEITTRAELANVIGNSTIKSYSDEILSIEDLNQARQTAIDKIDEEIKKNAELVKTSEFEDYKEALETQTSGYSVSMEGYQLTDFSSYFDDMIKLNGITTLSSNSLEGFVNSLKNTINAMQEADDGTNKYSKLLTYLSDTLVEYEGKQNDTNETISKYSYNLGLLGEVFDTSTNSFRTMTEEEKKEFDIQQMNNAVLSNTASQYDYTTEQIQEYADSLGITYEEAEKLLNGTVELSDAMSTLNTQLSSLSNVTLDGLADAFSIAQEVMDSYNNGQDLSMSNYESLMGLGADYLSLLLDENGNLKSITDSYLDLYDAKIDQMAIDQAMNLIQKAEDMAKVGQSYVEASKGVDKYTTSLWDSVYATLSLSSADESSKKTLTNQIKTLRTWASQAKKNIHAQGQYTKTTSDNTDATKANTDAQKELVDTLQDEVDNYKTVISYINDKLDDQIDKLKDLKDTALDSIDAQIDALNEQKDAEEKFWNDKIDALNAENDAIEDQLELQELLNNLMVAQSKKVKVYKEGQGFVYDVDQNEVDKAKQELDDYNRKKALTDQIKELEQNRDEKLNNYNKQIDDLNNYKDEVEKNYDNQIKYFQDYKNNFKDIVDSYENEQNRLLALQLTGIDFEQDGWQTRLSGLSNFVANYTSKLKELQKANEDYKKSQSGSGGETPLITHSTTSTKPYTVFKVLGAYSTSGEASSKIGSLGGEGVTSFNGKYAVYKKLSGNYDSASSASITVGKLTASSQGKIKYGYKQFASGTPNVDENGMAIVGENPYKEIVIGSKLNNGVAMNLSKGSGVVNAKSTNTLAGILNSLGSINQPLSENSSLSQGFSISIGNLSLPNVQNPTDFVKGIKELAIQKAYSLV